MTPTIWTVGHSNHSFETFVSLLAGQGIEFVADVRSYPYSRFAPQFNREDLQVTLRERGMRYVFFGDELGGRPSTEEHYDAEGHALYGPMSQEPRFLEAIDRLVAGAKDHRIAILCSEADPLSCHRRLLVGKVLTQRGLELECPRFGGHLALPQVLWSRRTTPGFVESRFLAQATALVVLMLFNSNSMGVSMPRLEWRRRRLWKISMYSKIALASSTRVLQRRVSSSSTCIRDQNASIMALTPL